MAPVLVRLTVPLKLLPAVLTLIAPLLAVKLVLPLATLMLVLADWAMLPVAVMARRRW